MRKNLKKARQKAGMTQKQVAEYLGITARAYQQIEAGEYQGKIEHWDSLEDLFNIHQRELRELFPMANKRYGKMVLVYKCGQEKLNNLYYQMKEQRR